MSTFHSIELYDPESPSADDLWLEHDQSNMCGVSGPTVSCVQNCQSSVKFSSDINDAESRIEPVITHKPGVVWKSKKNTTGSVVTECDDNDIQAVKKVTVKASLDVTTADSCLYDVDLAKQQCSNSYSIANDSIDTMNDLSVPSVFEPVTVEKVHECDMNNEHENVETDNKHIVCDTLQLPNTSYQCSMLHTDSEVDIADPTEPSDVNDQTTLLSELPRTIKLSRTEDPLEPDDLLLACDPNCNGEQAECPRIIRLDRDNDGESHSIAQTCEISDPSEPTDTESIDDESLGITPREIKLDRVYDSSNLFDSFASPLKENSSSHVKQHVVQHNSLHTETSCGYNDASLASKTSAGVDLSQERTVKEITHFHDIPLSPTESENSVSDAENDEWQSSTISNDCYDARYVECKRSLSRGPCDRMKSDHSVSSQGHLSDGEIVDEEQEEFGIFQVSATAAFNSEEKEDSEQCKKKSGKKRLHEDVHYVGLQHYDKSEDGPGYSRSNKRQKMSKGVCISKSSSSSSIDKRSDRSVDFSTPVRHVLHDVSNATSKLPFVRKRKHTAERVSRSPEKLLVGVGHTAKRKVVVIRKNADKLKKERHVKHHRAKRKHKYKRHHKRRTHLNESRAHKHKRRCKKHKRRKHTYDAADSFDKFESRRNRSRSKSYDRIVAMIRSEKQQSSNVRHLRSVVVHKNTLISARQRSSSVSSCDSRDGFDNFAITPVCQNSDSRIRSVSGDQMHLSRLVYSGELEQDGHTTLLGECIKSRYGLDFDVNCISENLASLCSSANDANDEVEIIGISYSGEKQAKNNTLQNAVSSELKDVGKDREHGNAGISLDQQPRVLQKGLSSRTAEECATVNSTSNSDVGANRIESKKVMSSKEVQTQVSLFAGTSDSTTECSILSSSNSKPSCDCVKIDKQLQVSDVDNNEECINSSSAATGSSNARLSEHMSFSEVVSGIQSPENRVEEIVHVPRPVLLERMDAPKPTPDSPQEDFSDLYVTVPNVSESPLSVLKTIQLEQVTASADDISPQVTTSNASFTLKNAAEQLQLVTATGSVLNACPMQENSDGDAAEQLSSKISDSDAADKEQHHLSSHSTSVTTPAVHHLPPVVQHNPVKYQGAVSLRRHVNVPSNKKLTVTLSGESSTAHLPRLSATQYLQNEPVTALNSYAQSQQPSLSRSMLGSVSDMRSVPTVSPLSFFNVKSDHIPGICEDVEPDGTSLSSRQSSLFYGSSAQTSVSLNIVDVLVTTAATTTVSETPHHSVAPRNTVKSYVGTGTHMASSASSEPCSTSVTYSTSQGFAMPSVDSVLKQRIAPVLPLLGTIATRLFKAQMQQHAAAMPASCNMVSNSVASTVNNSSSVVSVPSLKCATSTVTTTDAVSAWITSLPQTTTSDTAEKQYHPSSPPVSKPHAELDFDVDAVESPLSDEIMSFSPPSSEHMMAVVKMKHTLGLNKKSSKKTTNGLKKPNKTEMTVSLICLRFCL